MLRDSGHATSFRKRLGTKVADSVAIAEISCCLFPICVNSRSLFMEKSLTPEEACRLVGEELGIDRSRVRPCFDENGSRVCCLVRNLAWTCLGMS